MRVRMLRHLFAPALTAALLLSLWSINLILDRVAYGPVQGAPASVHIVLTNEPGTVQKGEQVTLSLAIKNKGSKPVAIHFAGRDKYAIYVFHNASKVWFKTSPANDSGVEGFVLLPGQTRTYQERWDLKDLDGRAVPPGTYQVKASFYGEWPGQRGRTEMGPVQLVIK